MSKHARIVIIFVLALAALLAGSLPALAAQKAMKWKAVSHITKVELIKVNDAKNHIMGIYEHQGVALFKNGEAAAFLDQGEFDMYSPNGTHVGYVKLTFQDGSVIQFKYQGREYRKKGSDLPYIKGAGKFLKGSGRFLGIKGTLSYDGGYVTPYDKDKGLVGDSVVEYDSAFTTGR